MAIKRTYTIFDLYEKIENLNKGENLKIKVDELTTFIFSYLDQSKFINIKEIKKHFLFQYDENLKAFICINSKKFKVSI